jgi:phosphoribosyl 1,2-cyclic phosphodiesterase
MAGSLLGPVPERGFHLKIATLGSGSRGNSVLVESNSTRILVDAGFSGSELARRLADLGRRPEEIDAVVVTHEHRDHTAGIGVAARRWGWPLFMTERTAEACDGLLRGQESIEHFPAGSRFRIGSLEIHAVPTCHDAADPVAVTIREQESGLLAGVATDLGRATAPVRAAMTGCHFLVLEANHDEVRLREAPYPWSLKQRIGGSRGHLSNHLAGDFAKELMHPEMGGILLAHLSQECNDPRLARATVGGALRKRGYRGRIGVAGQTRPSASVEIGELVARALGTGPQLSLFGGR